MKEFNIVHKYCGYEMTITGYDIYDAMRKNNLSINYWIEKWGNNMKHIKSIDLYTKTKYEYELEPMDMNKTVDELADTVYAPFGYTNAYINNNRFYITVYTD